MSRSITSPADAASKPPAHDVEGLFTHHQVELNVRVLLKEVGHQGFPIISQRRSMYGPDAFRAAGHRAHPARTPRPDFLDRRPHGRVKPLAGLGEVDAPRSAPDEGDAQPLLSRRTVWLTAERLTPSRSPAARNPFASATATNVAIPSSSSAIGKNTDHPGHRWQVDQPTPEPG